ncbi:MAG: ABC transporter permease [Gammaproteobacteria bacterium]|nr:ABC transporter permease [Gammaproteobacteria bacterium]MYF02377.1 ABC transporter permease [Gammaproteobacteria bacterium]MYI76204.1 ABC transporter permease [Gammaproteobacteria bacterium]
MRKNSLKTVWVVMLNEWSMTTLNPSFWIVSCATPTILFAMYFLFQWFLGEDPRETWFNEETVKNWEFLLGDEGLGQNTRSPRVLSYGVFDPSESFSAEIRREIINNNSCLFLKSTLGMSAEDFEAFSDVHSDSHTSLVQELAVLRQQFDSMSTNMLVDQLLTRVELSEEISDVVEISILQERVKHWVVHNQTEIVESMPNLTSNLFREIPPLDNTHSKDNLESMLARSEIIGYFVFPESISNDLDHLHFVTTVRTPRREFIDLLNWYRSVAMDVLRKRRYEAEDIDSITQASLLQRVDVVPTDIEVSLTGTRITTEIFVRVLYIVLALLMYLVFLGGSVRLVANVVDEKSSKLVDNLLANLSPSHLLDGKLWGTAMISLTVMGLWVVLISILAFVTGRLDFNVNLDVFSILLQSTVVFNFILFLLLAYAFYGYLFVGLASLFSKLSNAINTFVGVGLGIGFLFVFPSLIVMFFNPFVWLQNLLSFIPLMSPFVMVARSGSLPGWGMYCTIVCILVLSIFASRALSNLMFKRGISSEVRVKPLKYRAAKH